ncbi:ATP-binding protein [Xanthomonas axonopodis pv. ricini]|uniref:ATP-binding protein n=1 Tax=Xanthomonas euvesicatoria TaxID=456327 RepID=UPI002456EF8F|nr:ATP-binding protein [Xanthomonas euvesicatoria]MDH4910063.1 ATP-binding protein [Xanthomonas euvesicatoria]
MPRKILEKAGHHYRRILYLSTVVLSLTIVAAALSFCRGMMAQYQEHRVSQFVKNKEEVQEQITQISARIAQFADLYERSWSLRGGDPVPVQKYARQLSRNGGVTVTEADMTQTPFMLMSSLYQPKDQATLAMNLRALRDLSAMPFMDGSLGMRFYGYLYAPNASFFASSSVPFGMATDHVWHKYPDEYVREHISTAERAIKNHPDASVRSGEPIWAAVNGAHDKGLMSRLIVPMYRSGKRVLTMSLVIPEGQLGRLVPEANERGTGFFLFSANGREVTLGTASPSPRDHVLLERVQGVKGLLADAGYSPTTKYVNGLFIVTQRVLGPEWIAVSVYTWEDVLKDMRVEFVTGSLACIVALVLMWALMLYLESRVAHPLLDTAGYLLESQDFRRAIVDTLPIGVGVYAPDTQELVLENDVAKRMLGSKINDDTIGFYQNLMRLREGGAGRGHSFTEVKWEISGDVSSYLGVASSQARFEGRPVIIFGIIDLNERKASERILIHAKEAADEANRAKSRFLAIASHEIRTPLHGAIGHLELLSSSALEQQQREWVGMIRRSFESLLGLVNDLLDQTKLEANALQISPVSMVPNDIVESCARNFGASIVRAGIEFYCVTDPELDFVVEGDAQRVAQIIQNLLGNASKFTEHGVIILSSHCLRKNDKTILARFEVSDTGIGIPAALQASIFNPLTQADDSIGRRYGGTGLGLFLCRSLCQLMGGSIGVRSEPGIGSIFSVELPFKRSLDGAMKIAPLPLANLNVELYCAIAAWRDALTKRLEKWGALVLSDNVSCNIRPHLRVLAQVDALPPALDPLLGTVTLSVRGPLMPDRQGNCVSVTSLGRRNLLEALQELIGSRIPEKMDKTNAQEEFTDLDMPILVAEDDPVNRSLIKSQLAALGCRDVRLAVDGEEALELWNQRRAELVISDLGMPRLDGIGLLRALLQAKPTPMVVATTASAVAEIRAGAQLFSYLLQKPVRLHDLRRLLRTKWSRSTSSAFEGPGESSSADIDMLMRNAFCSEWDDERRQIEKCLRDQDKELLRRHLHRLLGALVALDLDALVAQVKELQHSIDGDWDGFEKACVILITDVENQLVRAAKSGMV